MTDLSEKSVDAISSRQLEAPWRDLWKLLRYGCVGAIINAIGFALYILLTGHGVSATWAMTTLYLAGIAAGYFAHRTLSFGSVRRHRLAAPAYIGAHLVGYFTNLALLIVFAELLGFPHQWVQFCAIGIVALELFVLMNWLVFRSDQTRRSVSR